MNKIYKIVWSKIKNTYVVVSEVAKSHSKSGQVRGRVTLAAAVLGVLMATALPASGVYAAGLTADQQAVYDAVLAKLEENKTAVHYFSVNSTETGAGSNYKNDGATGKNAIAIGKDAKAERESSVVIGLKASSGDAANDGVAVGSRASVTGFGGVAIGRESSAEGQETVAIGTGAKGGIHRTIAIGGYANADGFGAVAIGRDSSSKARGVALGNSSFSHAYSVGIGEKAIAEAPYSVAVGDLTASYAMGAVTLGNKTRAFGDSSVAIGNQARVSGKGITPEEYKALPEADQKLYRLYEAVYHNYDDPSKPIVDRKYYKVIDAHDWRAENHYNSIAIGTTSFVEAKEAIGIGAGTRINGDRGVALGYAAVSEENGTALGAGAQAKANAGVALGEGAVADTDAGVFGYDPKTGKASTETAPTWKSVKGAVSVGTAVATRQITNLAAGSADTDAVNVAQLKALSTKVDNGAIHYFSVKADDSANPAKTNWKNDGATGKNAIAIGGQANAAGFGAVSIGEKAMASKGGTVSIGRNAHILGNGGNTDGEGSVAIGDNALITTNGLDLASIALGKNAKVLNGSGKQERGLSFTPDNFDKPGFFGRGNTLPKNADKVPGGIAIGTNSYARTGSIQLGHHTFAGYKMGGIDVTNANEEANIVGMTTVGTNTYNKGALANMYGAYSIITGDFTGAGGMNSVTYGPQNFGANVVGSLNSIRSKGHGGSSGVANSIVGVANTVENANGTLVYGAGNKITNSITSISPEAGFTTLKSWDDTVTGLQKVIKNSKSGGAVLAIGGGNVADYVRHSQLVGVNNTVTGTENKVSEFNMVNGYQNTATNITHVTMIGSDNEVKDTTGAVLLGDKRKLTGADGSIVLGSADESAETNVKDATVIGHNANTTVEGGVALGSDSVADRAGFTKEKKGVFSDVDLNGKTAAAVSVGTKDKLRQIINVGDATEDTDAVNLRQLKVVNAKADKNAEAITNLTNTVNANGKATIVKVDGNENNADGNLKIKKTEKDGQLTYDLSLNDEISLGKAGEDGKDGKIGLTGKDGTSAEIRTGQGKAGVDGKDGETTTRIIYKDKGGKDHEVATLDDGLKFKGDNDTVVTRKLNEQLNITGGITDAKELSDNNIGVVGTQDGGMAVKLSKKLKGLTSAEFKDGDNVTNITAGDVTVTKKEGNETKTVNIWDLNKTVNDIKTGATDVSSWKLQANGKDERIIKKDSVVNFKNGENTKVTVKGNDVTVDLNDATKKQINDNTTNIKNIDGRVTKIENSIDQKIEGAKVTVEGDKDTGVKVKNTAEAGKPVNYKVSLDDKVKVGNVTIDGKDSKGEITGLTNTTIDGTDFAKKGRAATEEQLKQAMAKTQEASRTTVKAGDNITVTPAATGASEYTVALAKDISVSSITANEYKVGNKTYINDEGINANEKKITYVADGVVSKNSKDAVNGGQLFGVEQKVNQNISILGGKVSELDGRVDRVGAGAAALAALHPLDFDPDDKWDFAAGYGNYKGANAAAIGAYYRPNEDTMFSVGGSFGGGENMVNAGVSVKLGQGNHVSTSKVAMAKDMLAMQKRMAEMEAQMAKMQGFIGALTGVDTQTAMFPDVPENHWAYEYVKGLCEKGIIKGYPDGNFNGNRSMTRYEFAAMLYRALAKGVSLDARAVKEFAPELGRIRVDVISQNKEGQPVIERVRVNEEKKDK